MRYWEVIAPVTLVAFFALAFGAGWLKSARETPARHAAHDPVPAAMRGIRERYDVWSATVPVAEVAGLPPWAAPEADRYSGMGWNSGSCGSEYGLTPEAEAVLRGELHHVDEIPVRDPMWEQVWSAADLAALHDAPTSLDGLPREDGAGDESEGSGLTAPPAPPRLLSATDLANARMDLFMVAMRADHERWLANARERWAAA